MLVRKTDASTRRRGSEKREQGRKDEAEIKGKEEKRRRRGARQMDREKEWFGEKGLTRIVE